MPKKETSEQVSSIASYYTGITGPKLAAIVIPNLNEAQAAARARINPNWDKLADHISSMAASCLSQDETPQPEIEL